MINKIFGFKNIRNMQGVSSVLMGVGMSLIILATIDFYGIGRFLLGAFCTWGFLNYFERG